MNENRYYAARYRRARREWRRKGHRARHWGLLFLFLIATTFLVWQLVQPQKFLRFGALFSGFTPCTAIGSLGVMPDLQPAGTNVFLRYEEWHRSNPPCIPDTWVPQGCSYQVIDNDVVDSGYTRYPYHFMDAGILPIVDTRTYAYLSTSAGVQTLKCGNGFRELWWDKQVQGVYHEVSAFMVWRNWTNELRLATVPVAVHDPVAHGNVAVLSEWGRDELHPRMDSVFVGAPCDISRGPC